MTLTEQDECTALMGACAQQMLDGITCPRVDLSIIRAYFTEPAHLIEVLASEVERRDETKTVKLASTKLYKTQFKQGVHVALCHNNSFKQVVERGDDYVRLYVLYPAHVGLMRFG